MRYYLVRTNRETGNIWKAVCEEKDGKYVLKAGSIISNIELSGCPKHIQEMRKIAKIDSRRVLLEDIEFQTLAHAASFVIATNATEKDRYWKPGDPPAGFLPKIVHIQPIVFDNEMDDIAVSEDGKQLLNIEEAKLKKEHYKYEGRLKASQIKSIKEKKGYACEACGMSFAKRYPGIGDDFIECHHKIPYASMKEGETRNLNINDFMVLCSNCHKMIHRLNDPADLDQLKEILKMGD